MNSEESNKAAQESKSLDYIHKSNDSFKDLEINSLDLKDFRTTSGCFPTYFVFTDLPKHIEFRTEDLPILKEGMEVDFELNIRNPRDPKKTKRIEGLHVITRIILKYGGKRSGFTQYVEWAVMK